ncbi:MAG: LLM class F420-dependent oxidoreductase [Anaerolineales bacterium]|nr:LLM class F420-dependent oxidoreductase [Anaerolineales bacterium]
MRLGLMVGYSGATIALPMEMVQLADRLGYYAVWTAEAYGSDAVAPLAWIGAQTQQIHLGTAIMQMPARTPANTAMTAITIDQLSGGRMLLGLGLSGPQVVEGWHGVAYGKPLVKTREYVAIVRKILARKEPLVFTGEHYQVPYQGPDATGLGKPLKSIIHGRADLPIYLAAIGPKNVELSAEIADGWLPIFFSPAHYRSVYAPSLEAGFGKAGGAKSTGNFDIAPSVPVVLGDDVNACRASVKPFLALYVGGMGAKGKNFYYDLACRYGFEEAADRVQALYLTGQKEAATAAIPDELVDAVALCGPKSRIAERLELWHDSPITTLNLTTFDIEAVQVMADLVLGADAGRPDRTISISPASPASVPVQEEPKKSMTTPTVIFERIAGRVAADPTIAQRINAVYQFDVTGELGGSWVVDLLNGTGEVRTGASDEADLIISIRDDDFMALATGKLNPMAAFGSGKVQIAGDPLLALKLQSLFG